QRRYVGELHAEAQIGLVGPVAGHGVLIGKPWKRHSKLHCFHATPDLRDHSFDDGQQIVTIEKRGLDVDLRELGLTVAPQILVTKASDDLEIAFEPRHHQQLLEQLWRLRQRVEASGLKPARDQEVTRSLRSRPGEEWSLDLEESFGVEIVAHRAADEVADPKRLEGRRSAQVEVTVLETKRLLHLRPLDRSEEHSSELQSLTNLV